MLISRSLCSVPFDGFGGHALNHIYSFACPGIGLSAWMPASSRIRGDARRNRKERCCRRHPSQVAWGSNEKTCGQTQDACLAHSGCSEVFPEPLVHLFILFSLLLHPDSWVDRFWLVTTVVCLLGLGGMNTESQELGVTALCQALTLNPGQPLSATST